MDAFTLEELKKVSVEHYLGYHTAGTMSYEFDDAQQFTLVTSNATEADDVSNSRDPSKNGFIWVIEGYKQGSQKYYYLREVFRPTKKFEAAEDKHYAGAKKKFYYTLSGEGLDFERKFLLNDEPWFLEFKKRNGNFAFGLRVLADDQIKAHFLDFAKRHFNSKTQ